MALPFLTKTNEHAELVHAQDPDVTPRDGAAGWLLARDAAEVRTGATRVKVRPLNGRERRAMRSALAGTVTLRRDARGGIVWVDAEQTRPIVDNVDVDAQSDVERRYAVLALVAVDGGDIREPAALVDALPHHAVADLLGAVLALTEGYDERAAEVSTEGTPKS